MNNRHLKKQAQKIRRARRVRSRISGTPETPRLSVFRSLKHVHAQLIDDTTGTTLAAFSDKNLKETPKATDEMSVRVAEAYAVGQGIAEAAKAKKITTVVFDRGSYRYHGRVKAVASGAREAGLTF